MKTYLLQSLTLLLAFGMASYTKAKNLDNKFRLDDSPTGINLEETNSVFVGWIYVVYYCNWSITASYTCPTTSDDKGCAIEISDAHVYDFGAAIGPRIIHSLSGPLSGKTSYYMTVVNGYLETVSPFTQYKKISTTDNITNEISIKNRATPHI